MSGFGLPGPVDQAKEFARDAARFLVRLCALAAVMWFVRSM